MGKYAAFNAELKAGIRQQVTATIVITTVTAGNCTVTPTASGMTGSTTPITGIALAGGETADQVAMKMAAALRLNANMAAFFDVESSGPYLICTAKVAAANDATMNIAYADDTSGGLTDDATSDITIAGVAPVEIAGVTNISGPGLGIDTEDVTTHDQASAFEEVVATIIRSGEVTLDLVYDPAGATHSASAGGLIYKLNNKQFTYFDLIFVSTYDWKFSGYVTGFEPGSPVDGALTASVTIKINGVPTLE